MLKYILSLVLLCLPLTVQAQLWNGVLSTNRAIPWANSAGIVGYSTSGTLPSDSWTQCGSTIAPYGTSGSPASAATIINAVNHTGTGYTGCTTNQYVKLGVGIFYLSNSLLINGVSFQELRGSGAGSTKIVFSGTGPSNCQGGNGSCLIGFESTDTTYPSQPPAHIYNWTAGYTQGATSLTISSGANITANSTVLVFDQCNTGLSGAACTTGSNTDNGNYFVCADLYSTSPSLGCSANGYDGGLARSERWQYEATQVTACSPSCGTGSSTTVTISDPLQHPNWVSGQTPQVYLIQPVQSVGVRDITIDGAATSDTAGVGFNNCWGCWAKGMAILNSYNNAIYGDYVWHNDYSNNYIFNAGQTLTNSDATGIKYLGSNNVIQNNIVQATRTGIMDDGPANGTVVAYNFVVNNYDASDTVFNSIEQHSAGDDFEMFEGNIIATWTGDSDHGSHLSETLFRNFVYGWESCANSQCGTIDPVKTVQASAIFDLAYNRYANMVSNVVGTPSWTTNYTYTSSTWDISQYAFIIGSGNTAVSPALPNDSITGTTAYRWGNYDTANAATQWNTAEVPSGISVYPQSVPTTTCTSSIACPASFYYSSRPAWYSSSIPFPAIGSDVTSGNMGQCSGTVNTSGKFSGLPTPDGTICGSGNTKNTAYGGHVNANPAMTAYLHFGGNLDGTSAALSSFDESYYAFSLTSTTTSLSAASTSITTGANDVLTASVTSSSATGTVTIFDNGSSIGTCTLSGGTCTFTATSITAGTHPYTATYGGDSTYASSSSSTVNVTASGVTIKTSLPAKGAAYQ